MASLLTIPREILEKIALNLPKPHDVKRLSTTCRDFRRVLGKTNRFLWWNVWRKMYWMTETPDNAFCTSIDYWQWVADILVPQYRQDPLACSNCFIQAKVVPIERIYHGNSFHRALCRDCIQQRYWNLENLRGEYLGVGIPSNLQVTVRPSMRVAPRCMGPRQLFGPGDLGHRARCAEFVAAFTYPRPGDLWVLKTDAIAHAKATLPPEETSEEEIFFSRWFNNVCDLVSYSDEQLTDEGSEVKDEEPFYGLDFHCEVGSIVYQMINEIVTIYSEEYTLLHAIKSPEDLRYALITDTPRQIPEDFDYNSLLKDINPIYLLMRLLVAANFKRDLVDGIPALYIIRLAAEDYNEHIVNGRALSGPAALSRNLLTQHLGPPCELGKRIRFQAPPSLENRLIKCWCHSFYLSRFEFKTHRWMVYFLKNEYFFKCPFCEKMLGLPEAQDNNAGIALGDLVDKEEMFVLHILAEHYGRLGEPWNGKDVGAPPDIYEQLPGGELVKVDCVFSTWVDPWVVTKRDVVELDY
ncbi:hypothetical protein TWF506_009993 [Arthrobotrys conoides]|uniref:F-box domain-containing protein n=1 Tax=Arthrobotrys conoides TaxID=74498 RepID=A0AAN8N359_9PEZI